jgi:hypothetical protein
MASNIGDFRGKVGSRIKDAAAKLTTNGPLATPAAPAVSNQGAAGGTAYSYRIAARSASGSTVAGAPGTTATGNATLTGVNFNRLTWAAIVGAVTYDVYGRTGGGAEQLLANTAALTYDDTGAVTPNGVQPGFDTSMGDVDKAIQNAVEEYSKRRPREQAAKVAGNAGFDYAVPGSSFPGFVDGFSQITAIAYPYVAANAQLSKLEDDEYGIVRLDTGLFLRFWTARPAASEFFLALYETLHTVTVSASSVPASDDEALADLAAAYACEALAAFYSQSTDNTWAADSVAHITKAGEYSRRASDFRKTFQEKLDAGDDPGPSSAITEIDRAFGNRYSEDLFFHGRVRF